MKVKAKCPASCGELLQGLIGNSEKLISYPINMYSTVTIEEVKSSKKSPGRQKTYKAMYETLEFFGEKRSIGDHFEIRVDSDIPIGKGMASSTADVAACIKATAHMLGKEISTEDLAQICVKVEPTDSIIFESLTLFDHLKGIKIENFGWIPRLDVLVLESDGFLDTQEFRKNDYSRIRMENKAKVEKAFRLFKKANEKKDPSLLGKAATMSSLANQSILPKYKLEEMIERSELLGCYGVNVAHSGTVVGLIFDKAKVDFESLMVDLKKSNIPKYYPKIYLKKMTEGGIRMIKDD